MKIELVALDTISQDPANVRKHSDRNIETIAASLRAFGQQSPIVVDQRGIILKGNGTYEAVKRLGWESIKIVRTDLKGTDATAYAIADNRTAELAEWDLPALGKQFQSLKEAGFELTNLGFEDFEVNPIMNADWQPPDDMGSDDFEDKSMSNTGAGLPIALTEEQREIVNQAIYKVRELAEDTTLSEGRCIELICADYLAGKPNKASYS